MGITLKRRTGGVETEAALARLQEFAREQAERLGPYADQARDNAAQRWYQARGWTAPRLETAAQRVEDTLAPRVADLLNAAAQKVEPAPIRRGRRVPRAVVVLGVGALGAAALYGVVRLRQASQDAEWQQNLHNAREQVRETKDQLAAKARETQARLRGAAHDLAADAKDATADGEAAQDLNGRVAK
ncbi:hypothetical protein [Marinitenerispora sediminis]|uniref:DUF3618 domain-containing protein n=1 Tax=Marinitenerispora sediminis TaxID=1931232 RepID=A0A368T2R7_9ACTN|nr:hypothetical protein [Marinitenerispora sediminis]RCV49151.1 hypothetical protein DEF28_21600 [Marinitenerispora sediminis]RCV55934.1 hypothetical protein DEF24_17295 [Marinitenerispora sediminis]RCV60407.1 hypothetical protein DEF23_04660 [Marinitenerispora sediminis]